MNGATREGYTAVHRTLGASSRTHAVPIASRLAAEAGAIGPSTAGLE